MHIDDLTKIKQTPGNKPSPSYKILYSVMAPISQLSLIT